MQHPATPFWLAIFLSALIFAIATWVVKFPKGKALPVNQPPKAEVYEPEPSQPRYVKTIPINPKDYPIED